ncbi:MAG: PD-(D/E)XK nuclease family protein [Bryobacteraceae bacterium]
MFNALLEGATVVTAGNRLARTLRERFHSWQRERGLAAWPSPAILPWHAWMDALWEERLYSRSAPPPVRINAARELVLWEEAVRESGELLEPAAAAAGAQEAWALLHAWRLDLEAVEAWGNDDSRAFAGWARRVRARCEGRGWIEDARLPDCLRASLPPLPARVILAGFDEVTPQQRDFMDACRAAGCRIEMAAAPRAETEPRAVRAAFPDAECELEAAARWARALLEQGASNIAVVAANLESRRAAAARAFAHARVPVNISAGIPLSGYPLIRAAFDILALDPGENDWDLFGDLARSRYLAGAGSERTRRGLLDAHLRKTGRMKLKVESVRAMAREAGCPLFHRALWRWRRVRARLPERQRPGAWSRAFGLLLRAFGWPGEHHLDSAEFQTVKAWTEALSEFAALDLVEAELDFSAARALLHRIARSREFQPETVAAPVEVLGMLEASGMQFDHLWIAGLDDETWPGPAKPNPFLPARIQRERGMPHCSPERELDFAAKLTRRLLNSAPDIVVSHALREHDRELSPSPLILSVPRAEDVPQSKTPRHADLVHASSSLERLEDNAGPPANPGRQRGGAKVFQYQASCPFRAFAELRLHACELETPEPGLDARARGIVVHTALENVWRELRDHATLCACPGLAELVRGAVAEALGELPHVTPRFAALEQRRLERLVVEWLELEKRREPFEVIEREAHRDVEFGGLGCLLKLDRIDRVKGRDVIIDYKTGSPNPRDWETDRPADPQLPLYASGVQGELAGVLFARVKPGECGFLGFTEGVEVPGARPAVMNELTAGWRAVLEALAAAYLAGRAEPDPRKPAQSCRTCHLNVLCRIAEASGCREEDSDE